MELQKAEGIAIAISNYLKDYCDKIYIAGSIRRRKYEVKDIEIVLLPKRVAHQDLFGGIISTPVIMEFKSRIENVGNVIKGVADGRMMQIQLEQGIMVDVFMPVADDFYRQYAIRTGSSFYAHNVIAGGWLAIGWCGSDIGLRRQEDCVRHKDKSGKNKWICINKNGELPPVWKSEEEFFDWIKVKFIHPSRRDI
ncbi:MAG TPA: hypothetical protein VIM07_14995 [Chitinophagaceae bacterium]